ncbi:MAG: type II toxin-antitoxin system VapC family toxin [Candidatus Thioglobus sp.]|nr:MAG: type II toxin-antitoxin system VapC family toxin [Candidatus Thioglobus sp.]
MRIFLDTNIVIDFFDKNRVNHALATELIYNISNENHQIVISEDMISTVFYLCSDKQTTLQKFKLLQKNWDIVIFGKKVINAAIEMSISQKLDLEDTLQCICAKQNQCDLLVSSDKKFIDCGIKITNYQQFNNTIKNA